MYSIGNRGNTIDKTADILRMMKAEEGPVKKVNRSKRNDTFRLAQLYGAGVRQVKKNRGRLQPQAKGDGRDYLYNDLENESQRAIMILSAAPLLSEAGVRKLETNVSASKVSIFEMIHQLNITYRVTLSRSEAAALISKWDLRIGPNSQPSVDFNKLITKLFWLAEEQRNKEKQKRGKEDEEMLARVEQLRVDSIPMLHEVPPEGIRDSEMEKHTQETGVIQLASALNKLNRAVRKTYHQDKKHFLSIVNACDNNVSGSALTVANLRDFCLFNLCGLKLTIEEAIATIMHITPNAFSSGNHGPKYHKSDVSKTISLSVWLKELKLIALGMKSLLSPIEVEFDVHRRSSAGRDVEKLSYEEEMLINEFSSINSATKYHKNQDNVYDDYDDSTGKSKYSSKNLNARPLNKEVIIPIPEHMRKSTSKSSLPDQAKASFIKKYGGYNDLGDDWENLGEDGSINPSIAGKSVKSNATKNSNKSQGSRFILLGVDKPLKGVGAVASPIGKQFKVGYHMNKGGASSLERSPDQKNEYDSYDSEEEEFDGIHQKSKRELYEEHASYLLKNDHVSRARNEAQKKRDEKMKKNINYEYLENLSLEKAKEEEKLEMKRWQESEKRRLEEKLHFIIIKSQRDFEEEFYGGAQSEEKVEIENKINKLNSVIDQQTRAEETNFQKKREEKREQKEAQELLKMQNKRLYRNENDIEHEQIIDRDIIAPIENTDDFDGMSTLESADLTMGSEISYRMINEQSKGPLSRILKKLKKLNQSNDGNTNYSFSKASDSSLVSMSTMSKSDAKMLYIDEKVKQRYDTKFKHMMKRVPEKVLITRNIMSKAIKNRKKDAAAIAACDVKINELSENNEEVEDPDSKAAADYMNAYRMKIMKFSSKK